MTVLAPISDPRWWRASSPMADDPPEAPDRDDDAPPQQGRDSGTPAA